jgi:hypothetical protein
MMAERKETSELFSHVVTRIAKGVKAFKNRSPKNFAKAAATEGTRRWRETPNDWLELQYGWNPLMSDLEASCNALQKRESQSNVYNFVARASTKNKEVKIFNKATTYTGDAGIVIQTDTLHSCQVALSYSLRNPALASLASLGVTNPLELVWERIPYSFVIDWFLPVGNWLSSLDADFGWDFNTGVVSKMSRFRSRTVGSFLKVYPGSPLIGGSVGGDYHRNGVIFVRDLLFSSPWAGFPSFKNPFSRTHIANAMSLLVGAFRR